MQESFRVESAGYVNLLAIASGVVFVAFVWKDSATRYAHATMRRAATRVLAVVAGMGFSVYVIGSRLQAIRVEGDVLKVRSRFQRSFQSRTVDDIAYYDVDRRKPRRGSSYEFVTLTFADSARIEVEEHDRNYKAFLTYLDGRGVRERSILERPPVRYQR